MSDARQNGGNEHYVKHCKCALPVIFKRFSLLIGPNAVKRYGATVIPAFLSGIGHHFKRSVDTLIDECLLYTVQLTMRGRAVLDTGVLTLRQVPLPVWLGGVVLAYRRHPGNRLGLPLCLCDLVLLIVLPLTLLYRRQRHVRRIVGLISVTLDDAGEIIKCFTSRKE